MRKTAVVVALCVGVGLTAWFGFRSGLQAPSDDTPDERSAVLTASSPGAEITEAGTAELDGLRDENEALRSRLEAIEALLERFK